MFFFVKKMQRSSLCCRQTEAMVPNASYCSSCGNDLKRIQFKVSTCTCSRCFQVTPIGKFCVNCRADIQESRVTIDISKPELFEELFEAFEEHSTICEVALYNGLLQRFEIPITLYDVDDSGRPLLQLQHDGKDYESHEACKILEKLFDMLHE